MNIDDILSASALNKHTTIVEHKEWLDDEETQNIMNKVVDFLLKKAVEYENMSEYKGDNSKEHVYKEFTELVHAELK